MSVYHVLCWTWWKVWVHEIDIYSVVQRGTNKHQTERGSVLEENRMRKDGPPWAEWSGIAS